MEHSLIIRDIQMGNAAPVYLLHGEEAFFIDLIADAIENKILDESEKAFGLTVYYGKDSNLESIVSMAKSFPMMGNKQVIIVREAQDLKCWKKEELYKSLLNYLDAPTQSTVLAFCHKNGKVDGRSSIFKTLKTKAKTFESLAIKENQLPTWVQNIVKDQGLVIRGTATQLLADYLGSDLHKLTNEISKLSIVLNPGDEITTQIIQDHIGISKDFNVWELQTALIRKDVMKANLIINFFEKNPKDHPLFQTIPALYGFFAKLCVIQNSSNKDEAYKELGVNYYAAQNFKEGEKNYSPGKSERIIKYFRDADEQLKGLKGNSMSHGDIMRELIFKILH